MTHSFSAKLAEGKQFEQKLDSYFTKWFAIEPTTPQQERLGYGDRLFIKRRPPFTQLWVEYKADSRAHETRNAFIETESSAEDGSKGWAITSQADWIVYYLPVPGLMYLISRVALQERLSDWKRRHRTAETTTRSNGRTYCTRGLLVPLTEIAQVSKEVRSID